LGKSVFGVSVDSHIQTSKDLRLVAEMPSHFVADKVIDHIDGLAQRFIAASPLIFLASNRACGAVDVTPRGDPAGFVHVLDRKTLAIPDRPGNGRMDAFENIFGNAHVGLIFVIPGHRDTLRVSGRAALVRDQDLGQRLAVNGRAAALVMLVQVDRVLCHCSKAFVRSRAWQNAHWPDASNVPSLAEMMVEHSKLGESIDVVEDIVRNDRQNNLY